MDAASGDLSKRRDFLQARLDQCRVRDRIAIENRLAGLFPPRNPEAVSRELEKLEHRFERSRKTVEKAARHLPKIEVPTDLPIAACESDILKIIKDSPVCIIAGETGSGKTTQIPKLCLKAGLGIRGKIGCTQPRRIAALSVSQRVAEELGSGWGQLVGATIRFQDKTSPQTRIQFMTDGILLNELQRDPLLQNYEAIIVDEAHERSLNIDFIIGFLRRLRNQRPDLKIIITSATIDTQRFSEAFDDAPVLEVSGRLYPVEVEYRPVNHPSSEDTFYENTIDAVIGVTEEILQSHPPGDILIFMSGERSIREVRDLLEGRQFPGLEILPLFGRLSAHDQQKIFRPSATRRIVIATNIAETSITIPRIRYVIDTGLARISRYSPHTRTLRLPIEPISQSSARQRAGRCGRVEAGICFRLYTEEDLASRNEYTPPEIQRSNLASVLLQLLQMRIDDVETFPFLEPPDPRALRGGFALLRELKAVDGENRLTALGRKLALMPVDPTIAAMLLHAPRETCQRELLAIAAGLSIQDPRERPAEKEAEADQAHSTFAHPESDFSTLLNLWNTYLEKEKELSRSALRRWCQGHFLSVLRMREWKDIYQQLQEILKEMDCLRLHDQEADYDSIHRTILSGLLGNVALRDENNHYHATHSRKVMLFPGSVLFDAKARKEKQKGKSKNRTPEWILCGEWVETSRLFARTAARIEREWILQFGKHLFRESISEPTWDRNQGRVVAKKRLLLYGLEIEIRRVGYVKINPEEARDLFIRSALVEEDLEHPPLWMDANRKVRNRIEAWQTQSRRLDRFTLEDRIHQYFQNLLGDAPVGSLADLNRWIKEDPGRKDKLHFQESDLLREGVEAYDPRAFPSEVEIGDQTLPLQYAFRPGEAKDGATLQIPVSQFDALQEGMLDWIVPGYIEEKVQTLLRALPKPIRQKLHPLGDSAEILIRKLKPGPEALTEQLRSRIESQFQLKLPSDLWQEEDLPDHLKVRVQLVDEDRKPLSEGRNWKQLEKDYQERLEKRVRSGQGSEQLQVWQKAAQQWEREGIRQWNFGDLPEVLDLGSLAGVPIRAWPGLEAGKNSVAIRLFRNCELALQRTRSALRLLAEFHCERDLAWLRKDLRILKELGPLIIPFGDLNAFGHASWEHLKRYLLLIETVHPLEQRRFLQHCEAVKSATRGLAYQFFDRVRPILEKRQELSTRKKTYPGLSQDLVRLVPADFLQRIHFQELDNLFRYLRGLEIRADRYQASPEKDARKFEQLAPFLNRLKNLLKNPPEVPGASRQLNQLFWLLEEFRVSVFAQELGTAQKVSGKIIEEKLRELET